MSPTATDSTSTRVELGFSAFDADNHYYEAEDAFTRHIPRDMAKRCMQWAEIDGKKRLLVGGRVNRFIPNPTFDPVSKPGALDAYFRGQVAGDDMRKLFGELDPISPAYRNRDARVALMREQGLEGAMFFPPSPWAWRSRCGTIRWPCAPPSVRSTVGSRRTGVSRTRT